MIMGPVDEIEKARQMIADKKGKIADNQDRINKIDLLIETAPDVTDVKRLEEKKKTLLEENELMKYQIMGLERLAGITKPLK